MTESTALKLVSTTRLLEGNPAGGGGGVDDVGDAMVVLIVPGDGAGGLKLVFE